MLRKSVLVLVAAVVLACNGGIPGPPPPDTKPLPPCPVPDAAATVVWRTADQLEVSWADMPVGVRGGDEACVMRRDVWVHLPEERRIEFVQTFMGFDRLDAVEAGAYLYNEANAVVYRRSEHLEVVQGKWASMPSGECVAERALEPLRDPTCYDAYDNPQPPLATRARSLMFEIDTRVNGENANGRLAARSHILFTVVFEPGDPEPPDPDPDPDPECNIPHSEDPGWGSVVQPRPTPEFADEIRAAIAAIGDKCGEPEGEVQELLASQLRLQGLCARKWSPTNPGHNVAIERTDGLFEEWDATAANGCWRNNNRGVYMNSWPFGGGPAECGAPTPPPLARMKVKREGILPKWTAGVTPLVRGVDYCRAIGYTDGRLFCPVRPEGHPERSACERLVVGGDPQWSTTQGTCRVRPNPYLYRCNDDAVGGTVQACDAVTGTNCGAIEVSKD